MPAGMRVAIEDLSGLTQTLAFAIVREADEGLLFHRHFECAFIINLIDYKNNHAAIKYILEPPAISISNPRPHWLGDHGIIMLKLNYK